MGIKIFVFEEVFYVVYTVPDDKEKISGAPVLVEAALKLTGRTKFELSEAKKLVAAFANREVKH